MGDVDDLTLPDVIDLMTHWRRYPPAIERISAMLSAYFEMDWDGVEGRGEPREWTEEDLSHLAAELGS